MGSHSHLKTDLKQEHSDGYVIETREGYDNGAEHEDVSASDGCA